MKERAHISGHDKALPATLVKALSSSVDKERENAAESLVRMGNSWINFADAATIKSLIDDLTNERELRRDRVRRLLSALNTKALPALIKGLKSHNHTLKEESARVLGTIKYREAAEALISALEDDIFDVRWLAGEGLISIGDAALEPVFSALTKRSDSTSIREGLHRVLHGMYRESDQALIKPILLALEDSGSRLEVPLAAETALNSLRTSKKISVRV